MRFNFAKQELLILSGALLLAAGLKLALLLADAIPFNSDEAVVALMARHILLGERPVFFYGQAYMGSLDAWLVAAAFNLMGEAVLPVRLVQSLLYLAYIISLWLLSKTLFTDRRVAMFAAICAAIPTVMVTTYTTASLGGYGEILVLGNLILWLGYKISWSEQRYSSFSWSVLGLLGGLAFWTSGMALVYLVPVGLMLVWRFQPRQKLLVVLCLVGFVIGSSPWWLFNFNHGWAALRMLLESQPVSTSLSDHLISLMVVGTPALLGLRYPWSIDLSPLPALFLGVFIYIFGGVYLIRKLKDDRSSFSPGAIPFLGIFTLTFVLLFLLTRFGIDATGRYLLPSNLLVVFSLGLFINEAWQRRPVVGATLLVLLLVLNGYETWRAASLPELITTQLDPVTRFDNSYDVDLMKFLRQHDEKRGYSNYWVSFRLAFLSQEELIYAAELPYKIDMGLAPGDNRYSTYSQQVAESEKVSYITSLHPDLEARLRKQFQANKVSFKEQEIGPYHVFYNLSRTVSPKDIGLDFPIP